MMILVFVFGLAIGSFLNVVIDRLPRGETIIWKPSHCDYCKKRLRWFELIPVFSFFLQRGRCLRCRTRLSVQYPAVELITAVGFMYLYPNGVYFAIFSCLLVLFMIDAKHMILPDGILLVLFAAIGFRGIPVSHAASGIVSGAGFYLLWRITRGKGLGFGDVKLVILLGFLVGYPLIVVSLYTAFLTGATYGVILMLMRRAKLRSRVPFGPFLILGTVTAVLWGDRLWQFWRTYTL